MKVHASSQRGKVSVTRLRKRNAAAWSRGEGGAGFFSIGKCSAVRENPRTKELPEAKIEEGAVET